MELIGKKKFLELEQEILNKGFKKEYKSTNQYTMAYRVNQNDNQINIAKLAKATSLPVESLSKAMKSKSRMTVKFYKRLREALDKIQLDQ